MNTMTLLMLASLLINTLIAACNPLLTEKDDSLQSDWLVTAAELSRLSDSIGIVQWQTTEDMPGQHRICRMFEGASWSVSPNSAMNCVNSADANSSFEQVIESMYEAGILYPTDVELEATLPHKHDFALYTHLADSGHTVYDAFLLSDGLLFRATVTVGTPLGATPETLFAEQGEVIEEFLTDILLHNIQRSS